MTAYTYNATSNEGMGVSSSGSAAPTIVYSYTTATEDLVVYNDYLSVSQVHNVSIDFGSIVSPGDVAFDYKYITPDFNDQNKVKTYGGSSNVLATKVFNGEGLIKVGEYVPPVFIWIGSGTLFEMGGDITRMVAPGITGPPIVSSTTRIYTGSGSVEYNINSSKSRNYTYDFGVSFDDTSFITRNYGLLESPHSTAFDYGSIDSFSSLAYEDYRYIDYIPVFGKLSIQGFANPLSKVFTETSSGTLFEVGSVTESILYQEQSDTNTSLFRVFGSATIDKNLLPTIRSYTGFANLFNIGTKTESATYNYNSSSIVGYAEIDYQSITTSGTTSNYGSIIDEVSNQYDYGSIVNVGIAKPYGSAFVTGFIVNKNTKTFVGSGDISNINGSAQAVSYNTPEETLLFNISGGYSSAYLVKTYIASGDVKTVISSENRNTYNYDINAVSLYNSQDFGAITASGTTANYGSVAVGSSAEKNYGYVIDNDFVYPFGTLTLSGNFSPKLRNSFFGSGGASVYGDATVVFAEPTPQVYKDTETALFNVFGAATTVFQRGAIYSGSGSLFNIGGSTSSRTWSYTFGSIVEFESENYGFITASGTTVNYGLVSVDSDAESDYGYVFNRQTEYPYRGLTTLQGQSTTIFNLGPSVIGSGSLFAINGAADTSAFVGNVFDSTDLFRVTGDAIALRSPKYDASGAYKALSGSTNTTTYSYNFSATQSYTEGDYGSITASGTTINYGLVSEGSSVGFDYGYVIDNKILKSPFGSIFISGAFSNLKLTDAYAGSGTINVSGNAALVFVEPSPQIYVDKDPVLFFVTGNANVEFYRRPSFIGTGRISTLNGSASSRVFTYSEQSINPYSTTNYGFITASGTTVNYGLIINSSDSEFTYGFVVERGIQYPYGTLQLSSESTSAKTKTAVGEGSFFTIKGSAESTTFVDKSVESTELFTLSGASTNNVAFKEFGSGSIKTILGTSDSATYHYNTSSVNLFNTTDFGSITASGTTVNYGLISVGSDAESDYGYVFDTISIYPFGPLNVRGNATTDLDTAPSYVGSGSLFILRGSADTLVPAIKTDTETSLFTIYGDAAVVSRTAYVGSGSVLNIGIGGESASYNYNQSSTYADGFAQTYTTEDFGLITASGITENYGSITVGSSAELDYGTLVIGSVVVPYGNLTISGGISNFKRAFGFSGSGSINSSGAAGVVFAEPTPQVYVDKEIALFRVYGDATTALNRRPIYVGSGSLFSISESISSVTYNYSFTSIEEFNTLNLGTITTSGTTTNYGSITTGSTGDIDYGYVIIRETEFPYRGRVDISGSATVQFNRIPSYEGSGTLFETGGSALIFSLFGKKVLESTDLYNVYGNAKTHFVPSYNTSGSFATINAPQDSASYSYNTSSILGYGTLNLGTITTSGTTANYGSVTQGSSAEFDYGYLIDTDVVYPFGTLNVYGSSPSIRILGVSIPATGSLFAIGGEADSRAITVETDTETTNLFNVYGEANVQVASAYDQFSSISFGSFFGTGYIEERATYHYNTSSKNLFSQFDYQSVSTSPSITADYGLIINETNSELNYGYINQNQSLYAFGPFTIGGSVTSSFLPTLNFKGSGRIDIYGACDLVVILTAKKEPESTDLYEVSGSANVAVIKPVPQEKGYITLLSGAAESVTYIYNETVVNEFSGIDYGTITASGTTIDYGSVTIPSSSGIDYGSVVFTTTTYPYGSFSYSGSAAAVFNLGPIYIGSGSLLATGGAAETVLFAAETTDLFKVSGSANAPFIKSYVGDGSLFNIGEKIEAATFAYNTYSVSEFVSQDYQSVSSVAGIANNYDSIDDEPALALSYGLITDVTTLYPFGTFNVSGSAAVVAYQVYTQIGTGSLFATGGSAETRLFAEVSTDLFKVSGSANAPFSRPYTGTGSLFKIGDKIEAVTYSYNGSSEIPFNNFDYGLVTAFGITENYGSITNNSAVAEDYGSITLIDPIKPYGAIRFNGSSGVVFAPTPYQGSGTLFAAGGEADAKVIIASTETQLFTISGAASNVQRGFGYFATGSLFNIGSLEEKVAYSYNTSSSTKFENLDYQFIDNSPTITDDYGYINNAAGDIDDYGNIGITSQQTPFGILNLSGGSAEVFKPILAWNGSGNINIRGEVLVGFTLSGKFSPESTDLFTIFGTAESSRPFVAVTGGSLFTVGDRVERASYSYNTSSIVAYDTRDYQFITASGITIDYGNILGTQTNIENYGYIVNLEYAYPFGKFRILGGEDESIIRRRAFAGSGSLFAIGGEGDAYSRIAVTETQLFNISGSAIEKNTERYIGTGSLFSYNGLVESVAVSPDEETTGLFRISGAAIEKNTERYIGSGDAITIQTAIFPEYLYYRPVPRYVNSVYGPIGGEFSISGAISQRATNSYVGTGSIFAGGTAVEVFQKAYVGSGVEFVSGTSKERFMPVHIGTGSLFSIGGISEATTKVVPSETQLFKVSGAAVETHTEVYIGTGTEFVSGDSTTSKSNIHIGSGSLFTFNSGTESVAVVATTTILYNISGQATEAFGRATYEGSGSLFTQNGIAESRTYIAPTETCLFRVSSATTESVTSANVGSGTEFVSGISINSFIPRYFGSGSLFAVGGEGNAYARIASTETQLFNVTGSAEASRTNLYVGSGSLFAINSGTESAAVVPLTTGLYNINGQATESRTQTQIGSGSLFAVGGASVVFSDVATTETQLFRISGAATEAHTEFYSGSGSEFISGTAAERYLPTIIGTGSLFAFNSATESSTVSIPTETQLFRVSGSADIRESNTYVAFGTEFISGSLTENSRKSYVGSGSLFTINSATESTSIAVQAETQLFRVSGSALEKDSASYVGSGSVTLAAGAAEIKTSVPTIETQLFRVSGFATERHTESYVGTGTEFVYGGVQDSSTAIYVGTGTLRTVSGAAESTTISIPNETQLFRVSGFATTAYNAVFTNIGSGQETISGSATEKNAENYVGKGSLFTFNSASIASTIIIPIQTNLFRISGRGADSYTRISVFEGGQINISGQSTDQRVEFVPARIFGTII